MQIKAKILIMALASPLSLWAQPIYTSGHGDIGIAYDAGAFEPHWHLGGGAVVDGTPLAAEAEFAPDGILAQTTAIRFSPTGLSGGLGVADGTEIFSMGSATYNPNLGFAAEELIPEDWTGDITLTLTDWTIPDGAELALFTTNLGGTSVTDIAFSTFDADVTYADNSISLTPGDHFHLQWGMTIAGQYDLEFTWTGVNAEDGPISATANFSLQAVPEPTVTALFMAFATLGVVTFWRRKRKS